MTKKVSVLQIGSSPEGTQATLDKILSFENEIKDANPDILVMPEATLGGYPKGESFGTQLGFRLESGRDTFKNYYDAAIDLSGKEVKTLCDLSSRINANIVIGVIERAGGTLYCTAIFIDPKDGLTHKHRKLMPTGSERLIWGQGDGSTLPIVETNAGKAGAAICWENYMPLLRTTMYSKGVEIWCAPTVDARPVWQSTMQHIALEGRCFVASACQYQPSPNALGVNVENWVSDDALIPGGSVIIGPLGDVLAGPLHEKEGLISAEIDLDDIARGKYDLDVIGHYGRPDIFELRVNETPRQSVTTFVETDD
ncbi:carbon-nitrogen hydrolase family protein [Pseudemcibacter aquimaris]|uniref:carbon-nitrogen hydrolase family protein n=1 Tax=Pseudemcibacter aquimaris TaxID=2857064 RepID=UPI002012DD82|nr:carbon-nitrogen hydrolase family protein [Pseudemcibacter aquimaris]MCC3860413.1 carbon-nitrogen hydrolase family protein [Pseudemcibacter aquimaris]WDU57739.1 carbon-nitrogen hydrolase family protein [Pseudemcibacter aquimaris]